MIEEIKIEQKKEKETKKQIHTPDILTGFCFKCGKYSLGSEAAKYCNEVKG